MNARIESEPGPVKNRTTVERKSDREVVVTRTINGPARIVFEAFTKAELLKRWWVPKSMGMTLLSCEVDARVGGKYRLVFDHGGPEPAAFFGSYVEVKPYSRLAWTNEEGGEGGPVTTVTFEEKGGKTLLVLRESYPSKEALDAAGTGAADAMVETLDELIAAEVAVSRQRALKPMPPAFGIHAATPKEDRDRQIAHDAAAIVKPQLVERVGVEAACQEASMIVLEQWPLELPASTGIPV